MNELTDTEKISLLKRFLRQRFPLPILLLLVMTVIEPAAGSQLCVRYSNQSYQ